LGVDVNKLNTWERVSKNASPEDPGYVCRETEKASNIQSVRHLLNIKPGQNITPQMLKPYINGEKNDTNIDWLLMCWASKGFKDINLFLSDLNKLAYQETNQKDNTRLT
jgi:3-deoxy-D-manno-octulosonic acid (KDO) 8-phosphate synthase